MNIKNAIVLVEQIDLEAKTGKKPLDAVVSATTSRIVPVAMASGTTILGMLPLLFDAMFGGMAATIMGGLSSGSLLCHSKNQRLIAFSYMKLEFIV